MKNFVALLFVALTGQHLFGIDGKPILCIPESDLNPALLTYNDESTHLMPGNGHTPGFSTLFSIAEMRRHFGSEYYSNPAFGVDPALTGLSATVSFLGNDDKRRYGPAMRARDIRDTWKGRGACPDPEVRSLANTGLFLAKCSAMANYGSLWNRDRNTKIEMPDDNTFVVATCNYETISFGPYKGIERRNCARVIVLDGFMVDYRFIEENAGLIQRFDAFLKDKIAQWEQNCSHPI